VVIDGGTVVSEPALLQAGDSGERPDVLVIDLRSPAATAESARHGELRVNNATPQSGPCWFDPDVLRSVARSMVATADSAHGYRIGYSLRSSPDSGCYLKN
jgi:hypothetical protein